MFSANANYSKDIHFNWESFLIIVRDKKFVFKTRSVVYEMFI